MTVGGGNGEPRSGAGSRRKRPQPHTPRPAEDLDPAHDPGFAAARNRADSLPSAAAPLVAANGSRIRVGISAWTEKTLTAGEIFYPPGTDSAEERLRFYASRFSLAEVDSSYYALPTRAMAEIWAERTPDDFVFDIKAHALMTGHPTEPSRLPRELREALPSSLAGAPRVYANELASELVDAVWAVFRDAVEPLRAAGKLGAVLLQYPRWFLPNRESAAIIDDARARLGGVRGAVELRNHRWFATESRTRRVLDFLRDRALAFVMVDGPQGLESSVPRVVAATSPDIAVVRMHGRRDDLWERRGVPTVERYRYLYDDQQLEEWSAPILDVARETQRVHVLLNNCHGNYGTTNAAEIGAMMVERDEAQGRGRVVTM